VAPWSRTRNPCNRHSDDAKARLITLRALQAAAQARDAAMKSLAQKLTPLVETKRIEMAPTMDRRFSSSGLGAF